MYVKREMVVMVLGLVVMGLLFSACEARNNTDGEEVQPLVKAKRVEIVDDSGATRLVMTTVDGGRPSLTFVDQAGKDRAWLFLSEDGSPNLILIDNPRLVQMDQNGEIRFAQRLDKEGLPVFSLMDADGQVRAMLRLASDGASALELLDAGGASVWSAP